MLELDLTPPSGEGTILNRARHENLAWVGRYCHLGEKLHQPGFQLGHQGTSGVWLLLGNMMYIVQILHCKKSNIIDVVFVKSGTADVWNICTSIQRNIKLAALSPQEGCASSP